MRVRIAVLASAFQLAHLEEGPVDHLQAVGPAGHEYAGEDVVEVVARVLASSSLPVSTGISMLAAKSAGPKMMVSSLDDAAQISSTLISPRAVSICASIPMCPTGSPVLLHLRQQQVEHDDLRRRLHLGQHDLVEALTALPTTSITSPYVHSVSQAFTRTHSTRCRPRGGS